MGPSPNFTCSAGSPTSASFCSCLTGFQTSGALCLPICGDGRLVGNEICDDGGLGGCDIACSLSSPNYECSGGSPISPSICACLPGFLLNGVNCEISLSGPICGDGKVQSPEVCDDGNKGGCN